jgi:hypothetical protein
MTAPARPVISREQQEELDPILTQAGDYGLIPSDALGLADLLMAAYLLGRRHAAPPPADWTTELSRAAARIGAAQMAQAVAEVTGSPTDPEVIAGIERLTGETYDPATGAWHRAEARP